MDAFLSYTPLAILAFLVGYATRAGSICAVAATRSLIVERRSMRFRAFAIAAAGAGAVTLPIHWVFPNTLTLSAWYPVTVEVILAGVVFGLGARLNDACALGTLNHLTTGNLAYCFTLFGMIGGAVLVALVWTQDTELLRASPFENPSLVGVAIWGVFGMILVLSLRKRVPRWLRSLRAPATVRMGPFRAMLIIGICGGLLYAMAGNWTYMAILSDRAANLIDPEKPRETWMALTSTAIAFSGGLIAALVNKSFDLRRPVLVHSIRCFSGGALMGASAAIIPGGNGTMLVYGIPSLAPHALGAYTAMSFALCISFWVWRT